MNPADITSKKLTKRTAMARAKQMAISDMKLCLFSGQGWSEKRGCFINAYHKGEVVLYDPYIVGGIKTFMTGATLRRRRGNHINFSDVAVSFTASSADDADEKTITITCIDPLDEETRAQVMKHAIRSFDVPCSGFLDIQVMFISPTSMVAYSENPCNLTAHKIPYWPAKLLQKGAEYYAGFKQVIDWGWEE